MLHLSRLASIVLLCVLAGTGPWLAADVRADFAADVRTSTSASNPSFANRFYLDAQRTLAPAGTRVWFVVDRNGDGVPANPQPGTILGPDDLLALEDVVPGSLPATFSGRFNRSGFTHPDESLRGLTNVFVYLWQFNRPLAEVPHYEPPSGARFGLERVAATPQPDLGNATWRVVVDVFADARTVGGGTGPTPPTLQGPTLTREAGEYFFSFTFGTETGRAYQVQATTTLSGQPVPWTARGSAITGTGQPVSFTDNLGSVPTSPPLLFYRVLVQ